MSFLLTGVLRFSPTRMWRQSTLLSSSRCWISTSQSNKNKSEKKDETTASSSSSSLQQSEEEKAKLAAEELREALAETGNMGALSTIDDYRIDLESVAKELFVERLDMKVLSYPDVIDNDRYHALEQKCLTTRKFLASKSDQFKKIQENEKIGREISMPLRDQNIFGLRGKREWGGQGLCNTEALKLIEEFSCDLSLSEIVVGANTYGYVGIEKCGTDECKKKYLPKLYTGEYIGTVCMADDKSGNDLGATEALARYDNYAETYTLSGKKTWVSNAPNADVFTVFANCGTKDSTGAIRPQLTAFVVDKSMPGVTVGERRKLRGLKGLEVCEVSFDETPIPASQCLGTPGRGFDVYSEMMHEDRVFTGARVASLLREMINNCLKHCLEKKAFERPLADFDLVKLKITEMAVAVYTLESMTYMTAGLSDIMKEPDTVMEAAMTKLYAVKASKICTQNYLSLLGGKSYLEEEPFHQIVLDLRGLELWEGSTDILTMIIAMGGLNHISSQPVNELAKDKINFLRPFSSYSKEKEDYFKETMQIADNVHPSLELGANYLEYCIHKLARGARKAMVAHTTFPEIIKELDYARLAESATETYAVLSSLARANRSYCQGFAHGGHELELATSLAFESKKIVKNNIDMIEMGFYHNGDIWTKRITDYMLEHGGYQADHPVTRIIYEEQILKYAEIVAKRDKLDEETDQPF